MKDTFKILQGYFKNKDETLKWEGKDILDFDGNVIGRVTDIRVEKDGVFCNVQIEDVKNDPSISN